MRTKTLLTAFVTAGLLAGAQAAHAATVFTTTTSGNASALQGVESAAWKDDAAASGTNWSFASDGTVGTFTFVADDGPSFDFTGTGVSNVAANTEIKIAHSEGGGGASMSSFTITPATVIPEPGSGAMALVGLGALAARRRRN